MTMYFKDLPSLAFRDAQRNTVRYRKQDPGCVDDRVYSDYKCKDYCPDVFRRIQKLRNIDRSDYMMSIRSDLTIREIFSAGKDTSAIPVSVDDRLVVAVVPKSEKKAMLQMLPSYCFHLEMNRDSLLSILYGIHYMKPIGGPKVYFSVYSRVIPSDANIFRVFDLKGSWKGRKINKPRAKENSILKDMDFSFRFYLDPLIHEKLLGQIKHDCDFLEAQGIMDYSLLIGIALPPQDKGPECTDVVLYFSIVDIFQNYNLAKRLEHAYKSIKYDSRSIVTVNPKAYASRFQDFMSMIFHVDC
ncbi:phosphatidylinositol phosphate kinase [Salix suchowensis]|nr:phosphatidylinositol phosphate kinase [Salix suchowensis]KAG5231422.1 phosphatidylinositol phosphate kinase [Salix suchowensis]